MSDRSARGSQTAVFRVDARLGAGGGHVGRCLTFAEALSTRGFKSVFAIEKGGRESVPALDQSGWSIWEMPEVEDEEPHALQRLAPEGVALLVVDHYERDVAFERRCRDWADQILVIDDLANRPHVCDVLLDQTFGRRPTEYDGLVPQGALILTGSYYALLRAEFAAARDYALARRRDTGHLKRVLVNFGLHDDAGCVELALEALALARFTGQVDVVIGRAAPRLTQLRERIETLPYQAKLHVESRHIAKLVTEADLGLGAVGTSSWERCCLGLPTLALIVAPNQQRIAAELVKVGAIELVGDCKEVDASKYSYSVEKFIANPAMRQTMSEQAASVCDGLGAARVIQKLLDIHID